MKSATGNGDDGVDEIAYKSVFNEYGLSCFEHLAFRYSHVQASLMNATHTETNVRVGTVYARFKMKFAHTRTTIANERNERSVKYNGIKGHFRCEQMCFRGQLRNQLEHGFPHTKTHARYVFQVPCRRFRVD